MRSPSGRNAQHWSSVFGESLDPLASVNKKTAWSVHMYDSGVDVIFQLLLVKHRYAHLPMFSSDEVDFMMEFLCTKKA